MAVSGPQQTFDVKHEQKTETKPGKLMRLIIILLVSLHLYACATPLETSDSGVVKPDYVVDRGQEHFVFSRTIPPVLRVPSGAIVEVHTKEASNELIRPGMTHEEYRAIEWPEEYGHPLAGPVYI